MGVRGIARWSNAPVEGVKLITDSVLRQHQARSTGVWRADLRTLKRHPYLTDGTSVGPERLLWEYISPPDHNLVIIEDATAPKRADFIANRAEIRAANMAKRNAGPGLPDAQLGLIEEPPEPLHYRNTLISFKTSSMEAFINQLGGAWTSQPVKTISGPNLGRPSGGLTHRLKIEGHVFSVGSDWIVRVGSVYATGDQFKGVIMEIEYLPVDVLPYIEGSSAFLDAFTTSLLPSLPSEANFNSVVITDQEWAHVCGIDAPVAEVPAEDDIYAYGDEENAAADPQKDDWRRSAYMIALALRGEGLM
ncbi:hypothetical protein M408DRAFT_314411 [Serendipita vermifera MAFF 305830]|uniref:Mediator of RNA polymerase II transcription subunit 20 n=1 Tax=Serendipita vermifera MAFF 305830 TaxID=933852 RepID=A0A0C3B0W8_SERVB|nr:hypothetical protein M408DRAFT_314411 [Serendipita vermifera MAFF 305830]